MKNLKTVLPMVLLCVSFSTDAQTRYEDKDLEDAKALLKQANVQGASITKAKLKTYFENAYFKKLDANEDTRVSRLELRAGYLHCDTDANGADFQCRADADLTQRVADYRTQSAAGSNVKYINQKSLFDNHISLQNRIERKTEHFIENANPATQGVLTLKEVATALFKQRNRNSKDNATKALNNLYQQDPTAGIDVALNRWMWGQYFYELDKDFSGEVEIDEFAAGLNSQEERDEFIQILKAQWQAQVSGAKSYGISRQHFTGEKAGALHRVGPSLLDNIGIPQSTQKLQARMKETYLYETYNYLGTKPTINQTLVSYKTALEKDKQKSDEKLAEKAVGTGSFHYVEGRGLVFGSVGYNTARKQKEVDYNESFAVVRLIKDYTKFDGNAEPASFAWKKVNGKSTTDKSQSIVDGAIRVDLLQPAYFSEEGTGFNLSVGAANNRSGSGKDKKIINKGFLTGNYYHKFEKAEYWTAGLLQAGLVVEKNEITRQKSNHLVIEYEPVITVPNQFTTGVKTLFDSDQRMSWYIRPRIGFEEMDIKQQPLPTDDRDPSVNPVPDTNFLTWSLEYGLDIGEHFDLVYSFKKWHANAGSDTDFAVQTLAVEIPIFSNENVMLTVSYKEGETPTEPDTLETIQFGLGVLF